MLHWTQWFKNTMSTVLSTEGVSCGQPKEGYSQPVDSQVAHHSGSLPAAQSLGS